MSKKPSKSFSLGRTLLLLFFVSSAIGIYLLQTLEPDEIYLLQTLEPDEVDKFISGTPVSDPKLN